MSCMASQSKLGLYVLKKSCKSRAFGPKNESAALALNSSCLNISALCHAVLDLVRDWLMTVNAQESAVAS